MRFHHMAVFVSDLDEALRLWRDVMGFKVVVRREIPDGDGPGPDVYMYPRLLDDIFWSVELFKSVAAEMPERTFWVTRVGCGLAGFADWQMAPMFWGCPKNCILPDEWTVPANVEMIQRHIALYA